MKPEQAGNAAARIIAFTIGAYGMIHEINGTGERQYLIIAYLLMMLVLPVDYLDKILQRRNGKNGDSKNGKDSDGQ